MIFEIQFHCDQASKHYMSFRCSEGEGHTPFTAPYAESELAAVSKLLELGQFNWLQFSEAEATALIRLGLLKHGSTDAALELADDLLVRIGRRLFGSLAASEDFASVWRSVLGQSRKTRKPVTMELRFAENAFDLARFPWELAHDGRRFLFPTAAVSLTRYIAYPEPPTPLTVNLPLRVLVVVARPVGLQRLDGLAERAGIIRGLDPLVENGLVTVDQVDPPTRERLTELLSQDDYHVLHFDGHGVFAVVCPRCRRPEFSARHCSRCGSDLSAVRPQGFLGFEDECCDIDLVNATEMQSILQNTSVRLAVLSACQSATVATSTVGPYVAAQAGLAPALVVAGIPAVLGMQFSVSAVAAIAFHQQFYGSLANCRPLPAAVSDGRRAIFSSRYGNAWFIPALYLRAQKGSARLFRSSKRSVRSPQATKLASPHRWGRFIPDHPGSFVGRANEIVNISRVLADGKKGVLIWGEPGIGKTELAIEVAMRQAWRYGGHDRILWSSPLGGHGLEWMLDKLIEQIGRPNRQQTSLDEKKHFVQMAVSKARWLWIVDGLEEASELEPVLGFFDDLSPTTCQILATSREQKCAPGWEPIRLEELNDVDSLQLFIELLPSSRRAMMGDEKEAARKIVHSLYGHPLALELAAAQVACYDSFWALNEVLERKRLSLLENRALVTVPERLQSVFVSIGISHDGLSKPARKCLGRVSVFQLPWDEAAGMAVSRISKRLWRLVVAELEDKGLLRPKNGRYWLHPLVREFAYAKLRHKKAIHKLAAQYFESRMADSADAFGHEKEFDPREAWHPEQLQREGTPLEAEQVLERAVHLYNAEEWKKFCQATQELVILRGIGYWREIRELEIRAITVAEQRLAEMTLESHLLWALGQTEMLLAAWDDASGHFNRAYEICVETGGKSDLQAMLLSDLGEVYLKKGQLDRALSVMTQAGDKRLSESRGAQHFWATHYRRMGVLHHLRGEWKQALHYQNQALGINNLIGDIHAMAMCYHNIALDYEHLDQWTDAAENMEKAKELYLRAGNTLGYGETIHWRGTRALHQGDFNQALESFQAAAKLFYDLGAMQDLGLALVAIAGVNEDKQEWGKALFYYQEALSIMKRIEDKRGEARCLFGIGGVHKEKQELVEASEFLKQASDLFREVGDEEDQATAYVNLIRIHYAREDWDKVLGYGSLAIAIRTRREEWDEVAELCELVVPVVANKMHKWESTLRLLESEVAALSHLSNKEIELSHAYAAMGQMHAAMKEWASCLKYFQLAVELMEKTGQLAEAGEVYKNFGKAYQEQEDWENTLSTYACAARLFEQSGKGLLQAHIYEDMASVCKHLREWDRELELHERALEIIERLGTPQELAIVCSNLCAVHVDMGEAEKGLAYAKRALPIFEQLGDENNTADLCQNIGGAYARLEDLDMAIEYYARCVGIREKVGGDPEVGRVYDQMARLYRRLGRRDHALEYEEKAIAMCTQLGDNRGLATAHSGMGALYRESGDAIKALECYGRSIEIKEKLVEDSELAEILMSVGHVLFQLGKWEQASNYSGRSAKLCGQLGEMKKQAEAYAFIGEVYRLRGLPEEARIYVEQAKTAAEAMPIADEALMGSLYRNLGNALADSGDLGEALKYYSLSEQVALRLGDRHMLAESVLNIGTIHMEQQQTDEALERFEQAEEMYRQEKDNESLGLVYSNMGTVYSLKRD